MGKLNQHQREIAALEGTIRNMREAFGLLGVEFCAHCGKPHKVNYGPNAFPDYIRLQRVDEDEPSLICMDDPAEARCFLAWINKKVEHVDGVRPAEFVDLEGSFARWVLSAHAYARNHPMHGFVESVMAGESRLDTDLFAEKLLYWRNAKFGGVVAGETNRDLIRMCGWDIDDEDFARILNRCRDYAAQHGHRDQLRHFRAVTNL